jgi:hypothetical protein
MKKFQSYKINKNSYCKICKLIISENNNCEKCNYNLFLFIKAYNYFFFTIKQLNYSCIFLVIDIFNNFNKFVTSLKLGNNINELQYFDIIKKIERLYNINYKITKVYTSSNTKTFLYYVFK